MIAFSLRFLLFSAICLKLVNANDSQRRFTPTSTPERAVFGYSSAEDCLFGASSVLTRNVRFTGGDEDNRESSAGDNEHDAKTNSISEDIVPRPAFIVSAKSSKSL